MRILLSLTAMLWLQAIAVPLAAQSCRGSDGNTPTLLGDLRNLATSTDPAFVAQRNTSNLPATSASNVNLVTDTKTCQKAVAALNTMFQTPNQARQVYLFSFSTSFVAVDPSLPDSMGGAWAHFIYNKQFALQKVWISE